MLCHKERPATTHVSEGASLENRRKLESLRESGTTGKAMKGIGEENKLGRILKNGSRNRNGSQQEPLTTTKGGKKYKLS